MNEEPLETLCEINPETLGGGTPADLEFRYIDISAVGKGTIDWSATRLMKFADAPSRARRQLRTGDVLLCTVRPALKAHARIQTDADAPLVGSTGFAVLRPRDVSDSSFIFHHLFSERVSAQLRALETGSNYPAVNERDVRYVRVYAPERHERARIAAVLDTVDAAIAQTEAVIAKLKQIRAGLLYDLLTRGLDEYGQIRPPPVEAPHLYQDSILGMIPREWSIRTIAETASTSENSFVDGDWIETPHIRTDGIRLVQTGNIGVGEYLDKSDDRKFISEASFAALRCKALEKSDILICRLAEPVGRACLLPDFVGAAITSVDVTIFRPSPSILSRQFAVWQLNTHAALNRCDLLAGGTTRKRISRINLGRVPMVIPPLVEQGAICEKLNRTNGQISAEEHEHAKLGLLKSGLTADLLTGRVRVPEGVVEAIP